LRKFWNFRNAAEPGAGELLLYGLIGSDSGMGWLFDEITPKQFHEDLNALGEITDLRVFINSEGGDVFAGQAIHSMLQRHPANVTVYVDGLAASVASVIAMAGDRIIMPRNAMMMVHNPWIVGVGDAEEFRQLAATLDQIRETIVAAYESKTGMTRDELLALLDAETWMTAEEAVDLGFADEIEEAKQVAASLVGPCRLMVNGETVHLDRYRNAPKPGAMFGALDVPKGNTYENQFASVLGALSAFETRTMARLTSRRNGGRPGSDADRERWEQIQGTADRVLGEFGDSESWKQAIDIEYESFRAHLSGASS